MHPLKFIHGLASLANPIYKIAASAVMLYSLYHRHKQHKASNDRPSKNDDR